MDKKGKSRFFKQPVLIFHSEQILFWGIKKIIVLEDYIDNIHKFSLFLLFFTYFKSWDRKNLLILTVIVMFWLKLVIFSFDMRDVIAKKKVVDEVKSH